MPARRTARMAVPRRARASGRVVVWRELGMGRARTGGNAARARDVLIEAARGPGVREWTRAGRMASREVRGRGAAGNHNDACAVVCGVKGVTHMKRTLSVLILLAMATGLAVGLAACNTAKGVGEDMQSVGENLEHSAEKRGGR